MKGRFWRKTLSVCLALLMVAALVPAQLIASVGATTSNTAYIYRWWDSDSNRLRSETRYVDANRLQDYDDDLEDLYSGWYYSSGYKVFDDRVTIHGTVNIIICEEGGSYVKFEDGIHVSPGNTLNIYGQGKETQGLEAFAETNDYAGIGGNGSEGSGTINIYGGKVTAKADVDAAGIGGGFKGDGGNINIYGGTITATGGSTNTNGGAGIGGGGQGWGGYIKIYGGKITAQGGANAAGIGGGDEGYGGNINIYDGTITATGGSDNSNGGAGIGGGGQSWGGYINIYDGEKITAQGGANAAGIGGGDEGTSGDIAIYDGTITATGGSKNSDGGAGIGGGNEKGADNIVIYGSYIITAQGGCDAAGIGGGDNGEGGNITIHSCTTVKATGGKYGAGIGGGQGKGGGTIKIYRGGISATGGDYGAGIGGGQNGNSGTIVIDGYSRVKTYGGKNAAGIGGGANGSGDTIQFNGSCSVEPTGGDYGAGIGGGKSGSGGTIEFNGGVEVIGRGGINAAGIGGGDEGEGGDITIRTGHVDGFGGSVNSDGGAGIGGGNEKSGGKISILGGNVRGVGGCDAAGIGGGDYGEGGDITIANDSFVRAEGGKYGAGIGGGQGKGGGKISITSTQRKVQATGGSDAAGIGGGESGSGGEITISNVNEVIADGGDYAAGIGGGDDADGGTITIDGGKVSAQGGNDGAGIGGGEGGGGGSITIKAGTIGAESHRNAAGIGGGEGAVDGTITISGGTTTVKTPDGQQSLNGTSITLSDDSTAFKGICVKKSDGSIAPKADRISWCTSTANRTLMIMSCEHDGVTYTDKNQGVHTKTCPHCSCVADESHTYDEPVWDWAEDKQSATATFTCECGHKETVNATVTSEASHDKITYTATVQFGSTVYTDIQTVYTDGVGAELYGYSLSLDGDIGINFYMELSEDVAKSSTAKMHFTIPKNGEPDTKDIKVSEAIQVEMGGKTYYVFKCQVSAKEMTSKITAQIIDGEKHGDMYTYSVKEYADYLIEHAAESEEWAKAVPLVKAMLNYGAYSQVHFDKNSEDLANAGLTEEEKALGDVSIDVADYDVSNLPEGTTYEGATLSLKTETTLSLYFKSSDTLRFSCGDYKVETVKSNDYQIARIRGIKAKHIGDVFTLNVSGTTVTYSPLNYCKEMIADSETDGNLKNALKAFYLYYTEADRYFS